MSYRLKIFLIIVCLFFILFLYNNIKHKKMDVKSALSFLCIIVLLMITSIFDNILTPLRDFLGFEVTSNMIFFIGYVCVGLVIISLGIKISTQEQKITKLVQEIAILKKEKQNEKDN